MKKADKHNNSKKLHKSFYIITITLVCLLLFSIPFVFAVNDWNSINNGQYGNTQLNYYTGNYINENIGVGNYQETTTGGTYAPSVLDINYDGVNELIAYSGSNVYIYDGVNNNLNLKDVVVVNGTIKNIEAKTLTSVTNGGFIRVVAILTSTDVYIMNYLNSDYTLYKVGTPNGALTSNIVCGVDNRGSSGESFCGYFTNSTILNYFHAPDFKTSVLAVEIPTIFTKTYTGKDIRTNTSAELLYASDVDADGTDEFSFLDYTDGVLHSKLYDSNSDKYSTTLTGEGYLAGGRNSYYLYKGYLGQIDLVNNGDSTMYIRTISTNSDLVTSGNSLDGCGTPTSGTANGGFILIDDKPALLFNFQCGGGNQLYYLVNNGTLTQLTGTDCAIGSTKLKHTASANLLTGGNNFLLGKCFFNKTAVMNATFTANADVNYVLADITGDYDTEIIEYKSGLLNVKFADDIIYPVSLTIGNATGGYANYYNPLCLGTNNITYKAKECLEEPYTNCNYFNDNEGERERISTNCGIVGAEIVAGDYSYTNPSFLCNYSTAGTYSTFLYLQTESNPLDFSVKNTQAINLVVVNGSKGINCDINYVADPFFNGTAPGNITINTTPTPTPTPTANPDAIGGGIDNFFDMLTGGANSSKSFKLMIGILIILGCVIGVSFYVTNFAVIMIVGVLSLVFTTAIGLIPLYILILCIILMIGGIMLNKFMSGGQGA
jgi:hypothetical protein